MINPFDLPSRTIENRSTLPDSRGIYFVLRGGSILYIGKAARSLLRRWDQHHRLTQLQASDRIAYELSDLDDVALIEYERSLIEKYTPLFNGTRRIETRIPIDLRGLKHRVKEFRTDEEWQGLSLGGKLRALIEIGLELKGRKNISSISDLMNNQWERFINHYAGNLTCRVTGQIKDGRIPTDQELKELSGLFIKPDGGFYDFEDLVDIRGI